MMITISNGYIKWNHNEDLFRLTPNFTSSEFACKCGKCTESKISVELIGLLESLRQSYDSPIIITSGYRCQDHQNDLIVRGLTQTRVSQHSLGNAADIQIKKFTGSYKNINLVPIKKFFLAIGVANSFIHVDLRKDAVRRWAY